MTCFLRNIFLGISFLFLALPSVQATHIIGGEMNYTCLGNDLYQISLRVYRDCNLGEALLDDTAYVAVYDMQGLLVRTVPMLLNRIDTVTQADDCLLVPENLCIETTIYRDTVFLAFKTGGYHIAYQRCCRNATILNIIDPLNTGATYDIVLTEAAMLACNTSPKIKAWPPTFICANRPLLFDHSAEDKEGDSLVYKLCTPLDGGLSLINPRPRPAFPPPYDTIKWQNPTYSLENLLGGKALTIDPQTGILTGTPAVTGQFVVGVCVEEYRGGQLISETRRDFQYNVIPCQDITANFDPPLIPCDNLNIELNNTSLGATDYLWKFLDQDRILGTSKEINPNFIFPQEGNYTIRLIVDQGTSCVDSMDQTIRLSLETRPTDFTIELDGCQDSLVLQLKDLSSQVGIAPTDWRWTLNGTIDQFVSTEANPKFLIKNTQSFDISLAIQTANGCFLEAQKQTKVVVIENAASVGPPDTINTCGNNLVALNPNFDPSLVYDWSFHPELPDPTTPNPIVSIDGPAKYTVQISDSTGICQFDKTVVIDTAAFVSTLTIKETINCDGLIATFQANQKAILAWDFGDGASVITKNNAPIEHIYPQMSEYEVVVTDITPGRCKEEILLPINTSPLVIPSFTWSGDNCTTNSIELTFTDQSITPQGAELSWFWELSDGNTSTLQNPSFTIKEKESINVSLTIQSTNDLSCSATKTVIIPPLLLAESRLETISTCAENNVALNPNYNPRLQYDWSANEGITDPFAPNPSVFINVPTSYLVRISDSTGVCQFDRIVVVDTTNTLPISIKTIANCDGKGITFLTEGVGIYIWEFGDGTPSIESDATSVEHTYGAFGNYDVSIQYTPINGCTSTEVLPLNVVSGIEANIDWSGENCSGSTIELVLEDQTKSTQGPINTWFWELSDGRTSNEANPIFLVNNPDTIHVKLTASSTSNPTCIASTELTIPSLLIDASLLKDTIKECIGQLIELNPTPNIAYEYDWSDNEGLDLTDPNNPKVVVAENTTYTAVISNEFGCTAIKEVVVGSTNPLSTSSIKTIASCDGKGITFFTEAAGTYIWEFGDGTPSIESDATSVEHTYDTFGNYDVSIQYTSASGCTNTEVLPISVAAGIEAQFDWSGINCSGSTIELVLEDQTNFPQGPIDTWFWELSDGQTSNEANPIFLINSPDFTQVKLMVSSTSNPNCIASTELTIPSLLIDASLLQNTITECVGQLIALNPTPNIAYEYDWSNNEGLDLTDPNNPKVIVTENTTYTGIVSNEFGCTAITNVNIATTPTIEIEATQDFYICEQNFQTELFAYSEQAQQQWWINEKGDTIGTDPELIIEVSKSEQFTAIIQDENGCTEAQTINISNAPIDLSFAPLLQICQADSIQLEVVNNDSNRPLTYSWSRNETIISGATTNTPTVYPIENTTYEFIAIDEFGCESKGSIPVTLHPIELDIDIESEKEIIYAGETFTLAATENSTYSYNWSPTSSLDNPTTANPIASPAENTEYQVTVTNELGCTATSSINVEIQAGICDEPYIFLPNAFTPDGDGRNDILYLRGAIINNMELIIYDRWGDEIFKSVSPDIGWDGTKKGKAQPSGVFGYYIYVECFNGEEFYKQGNVSLIR